MSQSANRTSPVTKHTIRKLIREFQKTLGLRDWTIVSQFSSSTSEDARAICRRLTKYKYASITFFLHEISNEASARETVRHELLHILLAEFDLLAVAFDEIHEDNEPVKTLFSNLWEFAHERTVVRIENLLDDLERRTK